MSMKKLALIAAVSLYSANNSNNHTIYFATTSTATYNSKGISVGESTVSPRGTASAGGGTGSASGGGGGGGIGSVVGSGGSTLSELIRTYRANYSSEGGGIGTPYGVTTGGGGGTGGFYQGQQNMRPGTTLHGNVNVLLGGAMLSVVITVVCVVCYCCHRNIKKRTASIYRQRWLENDASMEIYSVEQCYETSGLFAETPDTITSSLHLNGSNHGGPPPSYEAVVAMDEIVGRVSPPPGYSVSNRQDDVDRNNSLGGSFRTVAVGAATAAAAAVPADCDDGGSDVCKKISSSTTLQHTSRQGVVHQGGVSRDFGKCEQHPHVLHNSASCCSFVRSTDDNDFDSTAPEVGNHNQDNPRRVVLEQCCSTTQTGLSHDSQHYHHECSICGNLQPCASSLSIDSGFENITLTDMQNGNQPMSCARHSSLPPTINLNYSTAFNTSNASTTSNTHRYDTIEQHDENHNSRPTISHHHHQHHHQSNSSIDNANNNNNNYRQSNLQIDDLNANSIDASPLTQSQTRANQSTDRSNNDLDMTFNENGIIRLDMSRIMDKTGLPTYEAALKLESSGYV